MEFKLSLIEGFLDHLQENFAVESRENSNRQEETRPGRTPTSLLQEPTLPLVLHNGYVGEPNTSHNTHSVKVRVHYPFHPLYGLELEATCKHKKDNGRITVVDPKGKRLRIPSWMLSSQAEKFHLSNQVVIKARSLLQLSALLEDSGKSESVESNEKFDMLSSAGKSLGKRGKNETDDVRRSSKASTCRTSNSVGSENTAKIDRFDGRGNYKKSQKKRRRK